MPLRGMLLILLAAVIVGVVYRKEMYEWFRNFTKDSDKKNETNDKGDKEE